MKYKNITISGKIAVGTSTLSHNLQRILGWKYINAGEIQRKFDREHKMNENAHGALLRSDNHERSIEAMTQKMLQTESNIIYEAWLAGFVACDMTDILRVLLICSNDAIRVDRIVNRDKVTVEEAKLYLKQREEENTIKWKKLYGDYDFWDSKYYHLVIDTYSKGQMETVGAVLDKLGYKGKLFNE